MEHRPRILLVDDDARVVRALQRALNRDLDVIAETDSRHALERIENGERFAVIVTDLAMPGLSGPELFRAIESIDRGQAQRMLFVSGGAFTEAGEAFLKAMRQRPLIKPFEIAVLRARVTTLIAEIESPPSPVAPSDAALAERDALLRAFAARFDMLALEQAPSSIALITADGSIVWVNDAWRAFSSQNKGDSYRNGPGTNYFGAISGELREWFSKSTESCFTTGVIFESDYECSSPTTERRFRMRMLPVPGLGFVISHSLRFEIGKDEGIAHPEIDTYRTRDGIIVMCSNCRRVRRNDDAAWDWVPSWLAEAPAPVSHGLCKLCLDFYYR